TAQVVALTTDQAMALTASQIGAFTTAQAVALETADIAVLSLTQIAGITDAQWNAMSNSQQMAFNPGSSRYFSPLVLDLDGNGVQTLSTGAGVHFDLRADGTPVNTGWVGAGDGLLVRDVNGNGSVDDGTELFGQATVLPDGSRAPNG